MKLWIAIVVLMFATVGHAGKAEAGAFYTGSTLLEDCESDNVSDVNVCFGYLVGIADSSRTYDGLPVVPRTFCTPKDSVSGDLRRIFIRGANAKPKNLARNAATVVVGIFKEAFPC
jgi:hypothetical protein